MNKVIVTFVTLIAVASAATIDPALKIKLARNKVADVNIVLESIDDIYTNAAAARDVTSEVRITNMVAEAHLRTSIEQAPVLAAVLAKGNVPKENIRTFWISNEIFVKDADEATVDAILALGGEIHIREPIKVHLIDPIVEESNSTTRQNVQWGVRTINAPLAWQRTQGEGSVVAFIDTGVYAGHSALSSNYGGAWRDPYYGNASPNDQLGHGTHCAGIAVGSTNGIGVAPGAKWIACRGLNNQGSGTNANLLDCAQWTLSANPRPHVVSNTWGGGSGNTFYNSAIAAWRAAGIVPVFAIGSSGPACGTANSPGDQDLVLSVGATQNGDSMASFSSRGPGPFGRTKPEVSAPGAAIVSAGISGPNAYSTISGTSMAASHAAGAVALMKSISPNLPVDIVISRLQSTAIQPPVSNADKKCNANPDIEWPNMAFGYGRIDAAAALP